MKDIIKEILTKLIRSFDTKDDGFSARKLTSFIIMVLIVIAHIKWLHSCYLNNKFGLLPEVLLIDYGAILTLLGLTTWEKVKTSSNTKKEQKKS